MTEKEEGQTGLLSDRHIVMAFCIGVVFVLVGFALEVWLPSLVEVIANGWRMMLGSPAPTPGSTGSHGGGHGLGAIGILVLLCKELGVAFMVAAIIGFVLEKQAKERDNERAMKLRADVANDAVFALYGLRHRREFVKAVVETNLEQRIVREDMELDYRLRTLTEDEATTILPHRADDALQRFVMLEMTSTYVFRNVSSADQPVKIRYAVPLRQGAGARAVTRAHFVRIGDQTLDDAEIAAAIEPGLDDLEYGWSRILPPDGTLPVIISVRCVKELSDNEVWGSFYPTVNGVTLSLTVLDGMRFGVRPLSSASLVERPGVPSETSRTWRLEGPLLKHNSAVFWWRTAEDDAQEITSQPMSFSEARANGPPRDDGAAPVTWRQRFSAGLVRLGRIDT